MSNFYDVCASYDNFVKSQLSYRGLSLSKDEVLMDTIKGSLCIASRGQLYGEDYTYFQDGISRIRNHILGGKFNGEIAGAYAARVLYLSSSMLTQQEAIMKISDASICIEKKIELPKPKSFSYLQVVDPIAYGYIIESGRLLHGAIAL